MGKVKQLRESGKKEEVVPPVFALLANGSSGRWSVTLDESSVGLEECLLQIEGPSITLSCAVKSSDILHDLNDFFAVRIEKPTDLSIGQADGIDLRLQWDKVDRLIHFTVGSAHRPAVRLSIHGPDLLDLSKAIKEAAQDQD